MTIIFYHGCAAKPTASMYGRFSIFGAIYKADWNFRNRSDHQRERSSKKNWEILLCW